MKNVCNVTVWKKKFTLTYLENISSNHFLVIHLVNPLLSRNFFKNVLRENSRNFHIVHNHEFNEQNVFFFREINVVIVTTSNVIAVDFTKIITFSRLNFTGKSKNHTY